MKAFNWLTIFVFTLLATVVSSCEIVQGIFSAGFYTGLIVFLLVIALIVFIVVKVSRKK